MTRTILFVLIEGIPIRGILEDELVIRDIGKQALLHEFVHQYHSVLPGLAFCLVADKPIC